MDRTVASDGDKPGAIEPIGPDFLAGFISEEDYAARRGVSIRTCQRDRQLRKSPPYVSIGREIYYRVEALRDWLIARERRDDRRSPRPPRMRRSR